jgi:hypothetical protein
MTFPTERIEVPDELGEVLGEWKRRYPDTTMGWLHEHDPEFLERGLTAYARCLPPEDVEEAADGLSA